MFRPVVATEPFCKDVKDRCRPGLPPHNGRLDVHLSASLAKRMTEMGIRPPGATLAAPTPGRPLSSPAFTRPLATPFIQ
jgi:hypothetical protein